jgi:hypothetical protein
MSAIAVNETRESIQGSEWLTVSHHKKRTTGHRKATYIGAL